MIRSQFLSEPVPLGVPFTSVSQAISLFLCVGQEDQRGTELCISIPSGQLGSG